MDTILFSIFLFCTLGCGLSSYHLGRRVGIEDTVTQLVNEGIIVLEDE
jgi:hypothetical protein